MLKELEFESDLDRIESKVCTVDFEYWSAADVWTDHMFNCLDSFAREFISVVHMQKSIL